MDPYSFHPDFSLFIGAIGPVLYHCVALQKLGTISSHLILVCLHLMQQGFIWSLVLKHCSQSPWSTIELPDNRNPSSPIMDHTQSEYENYRFNHQPEWENMTEIGRGAFGIVFSAQDRHPCMFTHALCAVKRVSKDNHNVPRKLYLREIQNFARLAKVWIGLFTVAESQVIMSDTSVVAWSCMVSQLVRVAWRQWLHIHHDGTYCFRRLATSHHIQMDRTRHKGCCKTTTGGIEDHACGRDHPPRSQASGQRFLPVPPRIYQTDYMLPLEHISHPAWSWHSPSENWWFRSFKAGRRR